MGFDYYDLIKGYKSDLLSKDTQLLLENKSVAIEAKSRLKFSINIFGQIKNEIEKRFWERYYQYQSNIDLIKKIEFFSPVLKIEHEILSKLLPSQLPKYVAWNYGMTAEIIDRGLRINDDADGILIGNSASFNNNHIDIINGLNYSELGERKILIPLNYGGPSFYVENLVNNIGEVNYSHFELLVDYLAYEDYVEKLRACSHVIMNHKRQQGGGNIVLALLMGAKVFIEPDNLFYTHYKSHGVHVFTVADLLDNSDHIKSGLTEAQILENREIVSALCSSEAALKKTKDLINYVSRN
jgi:hypothetical protein